MGALGGAERGDERGGVGRAHQGLPHEDGVGARPAGAPRVGGRGNPALAHGDGARGEGREQALAEPAAEDLLNGTADPVRNRLKAVPQVIALYAAAAEA